MLIPNVTPAVLNFNYMEVDNELEKRLGEYRKSLTKHPRFLMTHERII